jgi:glycerophosphoryl diester phosphodiesterase
MLEIVSKFNELSNTKIYNICFFLIGSIIFTLSYIFQIVNEKPCKNLFGEILRWLHHLFIYFIFYGFLAPASILWITTILLIITLLSWIMTNNTCFVTTLENKLCKLNKNHIFHDLSYYLLRNLDKFIAKNRIKIYSVVCIIIFLRLYDYYVPNASNASNKHTKIKIHGHRGASGMLPENTLAAFKYAIENKIDVLELDLQMTKDKEIVIYHDKNINTDICNGISKPIKMLSLNEIKEYDCGSKKNVNFSEQQPISGEKIPTFIELIHLIQSEYKYKTIEMNIEIKTEKSLDTDDEVYEFSNKLIDILHKYNITNNVIIQSFDVRALKDVKEIDPSIKTSYIIEELSSLDNLIQISKQLGVKIISPEYKLMNKNIVTQLHENGFEVLPWTINDINISKQNIEYGVDGIITDYPKQLKDYIDSL